MSKTCIIVYLIYKLALVWMWDVATYITDRLTCIKLTKASLNGLYGVFDQVFDLRSTRLVECDIRSNDLC